MQVLHYLIYAVVDHVFFISCNGMWMKCCFMLFICYWCWYGLGVHTCADVLSMWAEFSQRLVCCDVTLT
jgi:hypothetical protein